MDNNFKDALEDFSKNYLNVLRGTFSGLNLVGHKDDEIFFTEQVQDSVSLILYSKFFKNNQNLPIIDIGFGGGFPLLPLALLLKANKIIGLEARHKKKNAVQEIAKSLNITNVKTYHLRLEELFVDIPVIFVAKAVGPCRRILENMKGNLPIHFVLYKGKNFWDAEKNEIEFLEKKGWKIQLDGEYVLDDKERKLILCSFEKLSGPIGPNENKKLVNLSSLL